MTSIPFLTFDLAGVGGRIKADPEDFVVEEIPAYEPSGVGDFLYLWIEKRDMGAEFFTRQLARRLSIHPEEIGTAGLKDRRAVTRQWVSVPVHVEPQLNAVDGDGIKLLDVKRHSNKLRPGHLRGNRFQIVIRDVDAIAAERLPPILDRIRSLGMPNFFGPQRFGRAGETLALGWKLLRHEPARAGKFLRKLALSAVQAELFNECLKRRMNDGLLHQVLPGDVMGKWPFGGMFSVTDQATEQERFARRETVHCGPMFGKKMFTAASDAANREMQVLADAGLNAESFAGFGKLLQGTRRHNLIYIDDLASEPNHPPDLRAVKLSFTLPAGCYATVLLGEIMKKASERDEVDRSESE